jgi:SAM-dependent methyltransferase
MYTQTAELYDAIYSQKDYMSEVDKLRTLLGRLAPDARTILDVGCGTATHLGMLRAFYQVEGIDVQPEMLAVARRRLAEITFHQGDMRTFALPKTYDVVTCLFSSIGYMTTLEQLGAAIANMARHVAPGGWLVVEPWFSPEAYRPGTMHAVFVNELDLKVARMNVSELEGRVSVMEMHYMVGRTSGVETFVERHEMGLFTTEEYMDAFRRAGLTPQHDLNGISGRGRYVGKRVRA